MHSRADGGAAGKAGHVGVDVDVRRGRRLGHDSAAMLLEASVGDKGWYTIT
jgi:hypothetical protein